MVGLMDNDNKIRITGDSNAHVRKAEIGEEECVESLLGIQETKKGKN